MFDHAKRLLSAAEAARIIYKTEHPSPEQVDKVRYKLVKGVLKHSGKGTWTTTAQDVAEYLARRARQQEPARLRTDRLTSFYKELWRDYCLAVVARRKIAHRSQAFARAVLAGQAACLLVIGAVLVSSYHLAFVPAAPQFAAIEQWITQHQGRHEVVEWLPLGPHDDGGTLVRVKYKYFPSRRKSVLTDRVFEVRDSEVVEVGQHD